MEKLRDVTEEQKKFAIDAMVTLVVEELARDSLLAPAVVLKDFITSKTGILLYDESSKLWWNGPSYIADMYREERRRKPKVKRITMGQNQGITKLILRERKEYSIYNDFRHRCKVSETSTGAENIKGRISIKNLSLVCS